MRLGEDIGIRSNFQAMLRSGGKVVPGSLREGHNVFTATGRNLLARLIAWQTIGAPDTPFTNRRVRWIGVGIGRQLESPNVSGLASAIPVTASGYLVPVQTVEFPTATSVRFIKEFSFNEITTSSTPVVITEAGMFADVNPATMGNGIDDVSIIPGTVNTVLNPSVSNNPPIAYKAFEGLMKTTDFVLEIRWDYRFE